MAKDSAPGAWDSSASGHVDSGESYDACAPRELQEELGWTPSTPLESLCKLSACVELGHEFVCIYRVRWDGRPFSLHPEEIETGAWFTPTEIDAAIERDPAAFARSFRYIWAHLRERGLLQPA